MAETLGDRERGVRRPFAPGAPTEAGSRRGPDDVGLAEQATARRGPAPSAAAGGADVAAGPDLRAPPAAPSPGRSGGPAGGRRRGAAGQRALGRLAAPVCVPLAVLVMRFGFRWRIRDAATSRALYARLLADRRPLLVAANHLTMADSALIAWGLASAAGHLLRYRGLPWNVPERSRVESSWLWRVLAYLMKCIPVSRGGERGAVAAVLGSLGDLMRSGEVVLMFPEGGRSRSGRIDAESVAHGVGRLIKEVEGCRVLCVYLRGGAQATWSNLPAAGETFTIATRLVEPRTDLRGLRASRELAAQVLAQLAEMERAYLSAKARG